MKEYKPEDVFEQNVQRLIGSSASQADSNADAGFQRKLIDSVLAEVERERLGARPGAISFVTTTVIESRIARVAAAAVIVIAVGFLVIHTRPRPQTRTDTGSQAAKSPGEMLTVMSLNIAYRKGGMDAVERQYDKAFRMLGPRTTRISVRELFAESNANWKGQNYENN
ncbi:MAG: hypothetical protein ACYTEQ_20690 [Planctomycetota bacterium]|jgi:hypothetical protein